MTGNKFSGHVIVADILVEVDVLTKVLERKWHEATCAHSIDTDIYIIESKLANVLSSVFVLLQYLSNYQK